MSDQYDLCNKSERECEIISINLLGEPIIHRWVSIKDILPFENRDVLICDKSGNIDIGSYSYKNEMGYAFICCCRILYPTHWMPLPELPDADEKLAQDEIWQPI